MLLVLLMGTARSDAALDGALVISRDGDLWQIERGDDGLRGFRLFETAGRTDHAPAFSAAADLLAFERSGTVYTARNASGLRPVTPGRSPAFSPAGGRVVVADQFGLLVVSLRTGARTRVTSVAGDDHPSWRPGGFIAFDRVYRGLRAIYRVRPDGRGLRRLAWGDLNLTNPEWSPDGRTLAVGVDAPFRGDCPRASDVMLRPGPGPVQIRRGYDVDVVMDESGCSPFLAWSPDGSTLAHAAKSDVIGTDNRDVLAFRACKAALAEDGIAWLPPSADSRFRSSSASTTANWLGCGAAHGRHTGQRLRQYVIVCYIRHHKRHCVRI